MMSCIIIVYEEW